MLPLIGRTVDRFLSRGEGLDATGDPFAPPLPRDETRALLAALAEARFADDAFVSPMPPPGGEARVPVTLRAAHGSAWCVLALPYGSLEDGLGLYARHADALARAGFGVAIPTLPYHGARRIPDRPSGWGFVRADLGLTQRAFLSAGAEAGALARWLREERGATRVVGVGLSIGACGLGLAAATGAPFDALAFCAAVGHPASFYGTGAARQARRETLLANGYDLDRVAEAFAPIAPAQMPPPRAPSAFAIPPEDGVVPPSWQEAWRRAWHGEAIPCRGHGHGTALASRRIARRMAAWLRAYAL